MVVRLVGGTMIELTMAEMDMMQAELEWSDDPDFLEDKEWTEYFFEKLYDEAIESTLENDTELPSLLDLDIDHRLKYIIHYYHAHKNPMGIWVLPNKDEYKNRPSVIQKRIDDALATLHELKVLFDSEVEEFKDRREIISKHEVYTKVRTACEAEFSRFDIPKTKVKEILDFIDSL